MHNEHNESASFARISELKKKIEDEEYISEAIERIAIVISNQIIESGIEKRL